MAARMSRQHRERHSQARRTSWGERPCAVQNDALAHHITRLSGDDVEFDEIVELLIALQKAGHVSRTELIRLQASYLREAKS